MSKSTYTDKQILFIMNAKVQGLTYSEITELYNDKFDEDKTTSAIQTVFLRNKNDYDLPEIQTHPEKKKQETINRIIDNYANFVSNNGYLPTMADLVEEGSASRTISTHFNGLDGLDEKAREKYPKVFSKVIDELSFTDDQFKSLKDEVKKYKKFVITSAVTGCDVHQQSLDSLKNYCKRNNAKLLILPCSDPAASRGRSKWQLDPKLDKKSIVFRDLNLNDKFFISTIKLSAKQINPLTGLSRIGQRSGSFCYASPKQALEYVANSMAKKQPRALMTTGAITKPQYETERYMSDRTAYIADHDHIMGAIVVEIKNNREFFFRQLQMEGCWTSCCKGMLDKLL